MPNFPTQENPGIENFKPKKILQSTLSLEIRTIPPSPPLGAPTRVKTHLPPTQTSRSVHSTVKNTYVTNGVVFYDVAPRILPIIPYSSALTHKFCHVIRW